MCSVLVLKLDRHGENGTYTSVGCVHVDGCARRPTDDYSTITMEAEKYSLKRRIPE